MKKILINSLKIIGVLLIIGVIALHFFQEKLIFFPEKLDKNYVFVFPEKFEELNFKASDGKLLNGVLFKADSTKGLVFYLHGNGGSIKGWGDIATKYTSLHYDLFILDYRGYGKSEGEINSESQIYNDLQMAYDSLKRRYKENQIIIIGYSIGTGLATELASINQPKLLILQAPYYSLTDMMQRKYPGLPTTFLKYPFETNLYLKACKMPVIIFHGNTDNVIPYESSLMLKKLFKPSDTLFTLDNQGHNGMNDNPVYLSELKKILDKTTP